MDWEGFAAHKPDPETYNTIVMMNEVDQLISEQPLHLTTHKGRANSKKEYTMHEKIRFLK